MHYRLFTNREGILFYFWKAIPILTEGIIGSSLIGGGHWINAMPLYEQKSPCTSEMTSIQVEEELVMLSIYGGKEPILLGQHTFWLFSSAQSNGKLLMIFFYWVWGPSFLGRGLKLLFITLPKELLQIWGMGGDLPQGKQHESVVSICSSWTYFICCYQIGWYSYNVAR